MKCIGIIGAMEQEVDKKKKKMQDVTITSRASMDFYEETLQNNKFVFIPSKILKLNTKMFTHKNPNIFGGFKKFF